MNITHETDKLDELLMEDFNNNQVTKKYYCSSDLTWYQKLWDWIRRLG